MKFNSKDPQTWVSRELFQSYCGPAKGTEKLLRFYDTAVEKKNAMSFSLNWLAILILPAWLAYRKQWSVLGALTALFAVLPFIECLIRTAIPSAATTGVGIALGLMGNAIVLMSANSHFIKLKKRGLDTVQIQKELANKASVSVAAAIVGPIAVMGILVVAAIVADIFLGLPY